nr:ABC transporter ATP-binding protein [Alicyclobacillus sacchari]
MRIMRPPMPMGRGGMRPGMPVQKPKDFKGTLRRLSRYFKPHLWRLAVVLLMTILSTLFSILSPDVMKNATDDLVAGIRHRLHGIPGSGFDVSGIVHVILELAVLYVLSALFSYVQQFVMAGVAQKTVYALRNEVHAKMARLPLAFFDSRPTGEIMSRFVNDFDNIGNTLQQTLTQLISSIVTFLGVIVMMFAISPWMSVVVFLTLPLSFYVTRTIAKRSQRYFVGQQRSLGQLNGHIEEMYTGHQIVKAFGLEDRAMSQFVEYNEKLFESGWKAQFISGMIFPLMNFIGNIGYVLVSVIGGFLVTRGAIGIGDIQAFIMYARQFSQPITQLSSISNIIQSTVASAERIFELLDEPEEAPEPEDPVLISNPAGDVQFEDVRFAYQPDKQPLMEHLNLDVKAGQMVAVVGPTGAGKTTLVNLLMRFYDVDGGAIRIDGVDITRMRRGHLRSMFGMVLQDTWLFHGTIRDNIAYGRAGATEAEIVAAATAARADHFIRTLPDGYDTVLNEEASNISQGQKQLLTIARAILADPAMLILDEATSSVDTRTEILIQEAMSRLMEGRTSFVIAHRLSTIRNADLILVMNHGSVIEQGTHEELLARRGFYAELYYSQFAGAPA